MTTGIRHDHYLTDAIGNAVALANDSRSEGQQQRTRLARCLRGSGKRHGQPRHRVLPLWKAPTISGISKAVRNKGGSLSSSGGRAAHQLERNEVNCK